MKLLPLYTSNVTVKHPTEPVVCVFDGWLAKQVNVFQFNDWLEVTSATHLARAVCRGHHLAVSVTTMCEVVHDDQPVSNVRSLSSPSYRVLNTNQSVIVMQTLDLPYLRGPETLCGCLRNNPINYREMGALAGASQQGAANPLAVIRAGRLSTLSLSVSGQTAARLRVQPLNQKHPSGVEGAVMGSGECRLNRTGEVCRQGAQVQREVKGQVVREQQEVEVVRVLWVRVQRSKQNLSIHLVCVRARPLAQEIKK